MATRFDGYVGGINYSKETKQWEVKKLGEPTNGAIIAGLVITGKDKDGNKVYGSRVKIKFTIKDANEGKRILDLINDAKLMEFDGFFVPDNYTNKDGKTIQGNMILVTDSTTVKEKVIAKKEEAKKEEVPFEQEDDLVW